MIICLAMAFCSVILCETKTKLIIKRDWVQNLMGENLLNNGLKRYKKYTIFYSSDPEAIADFTRPMQSLFSQDVAALYQAHIFMFHGNV